MTMIDELGIVPVKFDADSFEVVVALTDFHAQPQGYLNGGVSLALAEITAGMASNHLLDAQHFAVGQSVSAEHLLPKKAEGKLNLYGQLLHKGKHSQVWDIQIHDEAARLIAHVTVTNHIVKL